MNVVIALVAASLVTMGAIVVQSLMLRGFLQVTPSISDEADLDRFREIARKSMYLTLVVMPFLLVMIGCSAVIGFTKGLPGLVLVLLVNGLNIAVGKIGKGMEIKARSLAASSEELAAAYKQIGDAWVEKMLPDF